MSGGLVVSDGPSLSPPHGGLGRLMRPTTACGTRQKVASEERKRKNSGEKRRVSVQRVVCTVSSECKPKAAFAAPRKRESFLSPKKPGGEGCLRKGGGGSRRAGFAVYLAGEPAGEEPLPSTHPPLTCEASESSRNRLRAAIRRMTLASHLQARRGTLESHGEKRRSSQWSHGSGCHEGLHLVARTGLLSRPALRSKVPVWWSPPQLVLEASDEWDQRHRSRTEHAEVSFNQLFHRKSDVCLANEFR